MAFDPDAYLAQTEPSAAPVSSGFDPDAYLAQSAQAQTPEPAPQPKPEPRLKLPPKPEPIIPIPTNLQVAKNAFAKGIASVPDMVANVLPNAVNLVTAAGGAGLYEAGLIDAPPDLPLENPDIFRKSGEAVGAIKKEYEPQTVGQRLLDAGVQSATGALLTGGSGGAKQLLANAVGGGIGGGVSQIGIETGHPLAGLIAGSIAGGGATSSVNRLTGATKNTALQQQNALRDENFAAAREAGIKIPVSQSNPNSLIANTIDIVAGGRPRMQQAASILNQSKATKAAARDLGLSEGDPISVTALKNIKDDAYNTGYVPLENAGMVKVSPEYGKALDNIQADTLKAKKGFAGYDDGGLVSTIDKLRTNEFDSASGVAMIRQLREDASAAYAKGDKKMGKALKEASKAIEDEMDRHLTDTGQTDILKGYREARQKIAKASTVEKALNTETGDVSAQKLARMLDKGTPLSGEMLDIARAAKLPGASLADTKYSTTGASQLEMLAGAGGALGTGNALMLALPVARAGLRKAALSDTAGRLFGAPNYKTFGIDDSNKNALMIGAGLNAERQE